MSRFQRFLRQLWTSDAHIPFTRITYRPHIVLVAFTLLVGVALFPDAPDALLCRDRVLFFHEYCFALRAEKFVSSADCLKYHAVSFTGCCPLKSYYDTPNTSEFPHDLVNEISACYYSLHVYGTTYRTIALFWIAVLGVVLAFSCRPQKENRETASV